MTGLSVFGKGMRIIGRSIRHEPLMFTIAVSGSVIFTLLTAGGAYVVGAMVGRVVVPSFDQNRIDVGALALGVAVLIGLGLFKVVGIVVRRIGAGHMQLRLEATYRRKITRHFLDLPLSWHHRHQTGTLLSNANSDVEAAFFPIAPMPFAVGSSVMLVGAVASLFAADWSFGVIGLTMVPLLLAVNIVYSARMAPRTDAVQRLRGEVSAVAHESFDGALVVKTMGRGAAETERFRAKTIELRGALIAAGRVRSLFDPLIDILPSLGTLSVLIVGAWRMSQGAIGVTEIVSAGMLFTVLALPVRAIGWVFRNLPRSVSGFTRVREVLAETSDMAYGDGVAAGGGHAAELEFKDVSYGYPTPVPEDLLDGDESQSGPEVLHNVSFTVPAGRTVALVGPTGSGKSTIASLSARLIDPDAGEIRVDGDDVRTLDAPALASTIALVPQVPFVFDDTVGGNITLDRAGVTDEVVWNTLRMSQASEFVASLSAALDTEVGERGAALSGGQKQRLNLARALAGRPRLLVLDDATSAVNPRVEAAILAALQRDGQKATILVVAYRRATIAFADEVVYVERGTVVARGTHQELLETIPGYADLVTAYEQDVSPDEDQDLDFERTEVTA